MRATMKPRPTSLPPPASSKESSESDASDLDVSPEGLSLVEETEVRPRLLRVVKACQMYGSDSSGKQSLECEVW
jgi:hypothetical protein